jgi:tetratricopeptide (TPR) repeat protein
MSEDIAAASENADPAALSLALAGASREEADAFLRDQRHHIHEQLKQIHLDIFEKWLGVLLRMATLIVGIAAAAGAGLMIWDASRSNGLLIEPFSVPPALSAQGITGQVMAAKLLDHLVAMQVQTTSNRAAKTYGNSWDATGIKLDIPETGISLAEIGRFLRDTLGSDTHVTGEVIATASELRLTARASFNGSDTVSGSPNELNALTERLAESIYRLTQPFRYAVFLINHNREKEAVPILAVLARKGSVEDRPWAYGVLATAVRDPEGVQASLRMASQAMELEPQFVNAQSTIGRVRIELSQPEKAVQVETQILGFLTGDGRHLMRADIIPLWQDLTQSEIDVEKGAFLDAARRRAKVAEAGVAGKWGTYALLAEAELGAHDLAAARTAVSEPGVYPGLSKGSDALYKIWARLLIDREAADFPALLDHARAIAALAVEHPGLRSLLPTMITPWTAYARARTGDMSGAEAEIASTPTDCYDCLLVRAAIAELKHEPARADTWLSRAALSAPSIPFAYEEWGRRLIARGQPDAAITKFRLALRKGPHFADPLEGWGEALMAKNQSHLALAKFAEAEKYAPNWGRLHLKWGEALAFSGKPADAKAQFTRAVALDLTPSEKSELARMPHG